MKWNESFPARNFLDYDIHVAIDLGEARSTDLCYRFVAGFDLWIADDADDDADDEVTFLGCEPQEAVVYLDGYFDVDASSELGKNYSQICPCPES